LALEVELQPRRGTDADVHARAPTAKNPIRS
jgi:hypothetical protein